MTTTLICPECQRENESERVFCHGCGARLDRSGVVQNKPDPEKVEQTHRRVQRLFDTRRGRLGEAFFPACKLILAAFVTAAVIDMVLPPDLPAPAKQTVGPPPQINFNLESAILYHRRLEYSQEQVNAYLIYALRSKQHLLDEPLLNFKHVLVTFGEGTCTVTVERSFFGYSLYQRAIYEVNLAEGKILALSKGGSIGRLEIHPAIMQYAGAVFDGLWSALARERKLVAQMATIEFHPGSVVLTAR